MERIESISDPRVSRFRNLKARTLRGENLFVTEGRPVTLELLDSDHTIDAVFVADRYAEEFEALVGDRAPLYVASEETLVEVVGFKFHRGVLAAGRRRPEETIDQLLRKFDVRAPVHLIACPEITRPENMGLIFRSAAAFGLDGLVLGGPCCDPYSRGALRVSRGTVFGTPFARSADLEAGLERLKTRWRVELVAAVLDDGAERLIDFRWPRRTALLIGNEVQGLTPACLSLCDHRVTIPMERGVDSLNLGVAAGVFAYALRNGRPST